MKSVDDKWRADAANVFMMLMISKALRPAEMLDLRLRGLIQIISNALFFSLSVVP